MVDREARNKMAELLRHFASGQITNQELCDFELTGKDDTVHALDAIIQTSFEAMYSKPYRAKGKHAFSREERRYIARIILFLQTDHDYEYERGALGLASDLQFLIFLLSGATTLYWIAYSPSFFCFLIKLLLAIVGYYSANRLLHYIIEKCRQIKDNAVNDGDESVWPFFRRFDYEEALKHPRFLCGNR